MIVLVEFIFCVGITIFPLTLWPQIRTFQASEDLIFNFRFVKTLGASSEMVVGLVDRDCPAICASPAVTAYISATQRIGWNLTAPNLFPLVSGAVYLFQQPV